MQRQKNWFFLCLLFIGLVGCATVTNIDRRSKFEDRVRLYSQAIRWSEFEIAQGFIRTREGHVQKQDLDFYNKIKVTKYLSTNNTPKENFNEQTTDIIDELTTDITDELTTDITDEQTSDITDEQTSGITLVYKIDYFIDDDYRVKHVRYEQLWWYDETAGKWFLDSDLPRFEL